MCDAMQRANRCRKEAEEVERLLAAVVLQVPQALQEFCAATEAAAEEEGKRERERRASRASRTAEGHARTHARTATAAQPTPARTTLP